MIYRRLISGSAEGIEKQQVFLFVLLYVKFFVCLISINESRMK